MTEKNRKYIVQKINEKIEDTGIKNKIINLQTVFINDDLTLLGSKFQFNTLSLFFIIIIEIFLICYICYIFLRKELYFLYFNITSKFKLDVKEINNIEDTKIKIENIINAHLFCDGDNLKIFYNKQEYPAKYLDGDKDIILENCDSYIRVM